MVKANGRLASVLANGVSGLALVLSGALAAVGGSGGALAAPCGSGANATINVACTGPYDWTGGNLTVGRSGVINGGGYGAQATTAVGTLTNSGTIAATGGASANPGVWINATSAAAVTNQGGATISSTGHTALKNDHGTIGTITNNGYVSATRNVVLNEQGSVGTLINGAGGSIVSGNDRGQAITNNGTMGTLINYGLLDSTSAVVNDDPGGLPANPMALANYKTIGSVTNAGTMRASGTSATGIYNGALGGGTAVIGSLSNSGTISVSGAGSAGINNAAAGYIGVLNNSGTIRASDASSASAALYNGGTIGTLVNTGLITASGSNTARALNLLPGSTLGSLVNLGTISGQGYAIRNRGTLGSITNGGVIAGDILTKNQDLRIAGGTGTVGILTGYQAGTAGTITADGADEVELTSGHLLLDDNVRFTSGGTLTNNAVTRVNRELSVTGNYRQGTSGALIIGVTSPTNYGKLLVSGNADLTNGSATLNPINGGRLSAGESYTIVTASTLQASGVTVTTAGFPNTVTTSGNRLVVRLDSWSSKVTADPAFGTMLDTLASSQPGFQSVMTTIANLPQSQQHFAIRQMGVSQLTPQVNASGATVAPTTNAVQQRQVALLNGDGELGMSAGEATPDSAVWGQLLGGYAQRDSRVGADGYNASSYGVMFGADTHLNDNLVAGVALSWLHSHSRGKAFSSGNVTDVDGYQVTGYGTWRPGGGPAYAEGLVAVGLNHYDQERGMDALNRTATADYYGMQYQGKLGGGYDIPVGAATLTPLGSMQFVRVENDSYDESGAGVNNLSVDAMGFNSIESELGAKVSGEYKADWALLKGDLQAAWVHSFTDSAIATSAVMGGQGFVSTTKRPSTDGARVAAGVTLESSDDLSFRLEYDGEYRPDFRSHTGLMKVRHEF